SGHQRDIRGAVEYLLALLLCNTTEHAKALSGLVQLLVIIQAIEDLLLGFIADRAGVVKDQAGVKFRFNLPIALLLERPDHLLRIMGVHLATERLKIEG